MNAETHMDDLSGIIRDNVSDGKRVGVLIVDGGADYNTNHATNEFFYSCFFREKKLDGLLVTSYCPGHSAYNPIEHLWAPITKKLVSVFLPDTLPGEPSPPCEQNLSENEQSRKEKMVFNNALDMVGRHLRDLTFRKNEVCCRFIPAGSTQETGKYREVHASITKSATGLRNSIYNEEYNFMISHMDRRYGMVIFKRCQNENCGHCTLLPPQLSRAWQQLANFPSPTLEDNGVHFKTYMEACKMGEMEHHDLHMPTVQKKSLGSCPFEGSNYLFTSQSDRRNHNSRVHPKRTTRHVERS